MVNAPKKKRTFCRKCKKHSEHKVTQYKAGKASNFAQGKRRYDRKQMGFGGQTKPIFHKKAKTTKKITLRIECKECKSKSHLRLKRTKRFELGMYMLLTLRKSQGKKKPLPPSTFCNVHKKLTINPSICKRIHRSKKSTNWPCLLNAFLFIYKIINIYINNSYICVFIY